MVWFLTTSPNSFTMTQKIFNIFCAAVFCLGLAAGRYLAFPLLINYHGLHSRKSIDTFHVRIKQLSSNFMLKSSSSFIA